MELAKRLYSKGHAISYVPDAAVEHIHEESWEKVRRRYEREALALRDIMPEVTLGVRDCLRYTAAGILFDFCGGPEGAVLAPRNGGHRNVPGDAIHGYVSRKSFTSRVIARIKREVFFYPK
ncbi:hypothetical protein ACFSTD_24200 [Novosphingobium colocasiae]